MKEEELINEYTSALAPYFFIYREVAGINKISGKKKRIDVIIELKEDKNKVFGIEFKGEINNKQFNYCTAWFKQAIIYTQTEWDRFGKTPILMCPSLENENNGSLIDHYYHSLIRIIGEFGIGELKKTTIWKYKENIVGYNVKESQYDVYSLCFKSHPIWSTDRGWHGNWDKTDFKHYLEL